MASALGLLLTACQGWRIEQRPLEAVVQDQQSGKVALTTKYLRWIVLSEPRVEGDSVVGIQTSETIFGKTRTALPIVSVESVATRQFSVRKTVGLAVAIALLPLFYLAAFYEP